MNLISPILTNLATINLIQNPSFELEDDGDAPNWWTNFTTAGSLTRAVDNAFGKFGKQCVRISAASASDGGIQSPTLTLEPNQTYTVSVYIKTGASIDNAALIVQQQTFFGISVSLHVEEANQDWQRLSGTFVANGSNPVYKVLIGLGLDGDDSDGDAWFDGIMVEKQSAVTQYCDGDQDECIWLGGAHYSQSQRKTIERSLISTERALVGERSLVS